MRRIGSAILVSAVLLATMGMTALGQDDIADGTATKQYLYVLSGTSGTVEGDTLTLEGVPSAVYFTDRPEREAGHRTLEALVTRWDERGILTDDPPNAVLSILAADGPDDIVVTLASIDAPDSSTVRFGFTIIDGEVPDGPFGPASVFVDPVDCEDDFT